jgi:hypothetical protein
MTLVSAMALAPTRSTSGASAHSTSKVRCCPAGSSIRSSPPAPTRSRLSRPSTASTLSSSSASANSKTKHWRTSPPDASSPMPPGRSSPPCHITCCGARRARAPRPHRPRRAHPTPPPARHPRPPNPLRPALNAAPPRPLALAARLHRSACPHPSAPGSSLTSRPTGQSTIRPQHPRRCLPRTRSDRDPTRHDPRQTHRDARPTHRPTNQAAQRSAPNTRWIEAKSSTPNEVHFAHRSTIR